MRNIKQCPLILPSPLRARGSSEPEAARGEGFLCFSPPLTGGGEGEGELNIISKGGYKWILSVLLI